MMLTAAAGALCALAVMMLARPLLDAQGRSGRRRTLRKAAAVIVAIGASVAVSAALVENTAARPRTAADAAAPARPRATESRPTRAAELAAVDQAVRRVKAHPREVSGHLALARAYAAVGQPQLATVEYLAVTRIEPGNPEANTALGLAAFTSGSPAAAKRLVDKALQTDPGYPDALYARGMVNAMGLDRPAAARRDLRAYLRRAPFGAHRTTVRTVLILLENGGLR